ncbi:hypothetical protein DL93DRAFT_711029 [Clavulina sp. PMI_390]|nr:hypothetical protein DL93DRAFT_711029 [Clavulina sp. PMI_390]
MALVSVHPYSFMFHRDTFWGAATSGDVPLYLLNSMFAIAAPLSFHPALQPMSASSGGQRHRSMWKASNRFADAALSQLFGRNTNCEIDLMRFRDQELPVAQSLLCLSYWDANTRRRDGSPPLPWFSQAVQILGGLTPPRWNPTDTRTAKATSSAASYQNARTGWIDEECLRRTLWVPHFLTSISSATSLAPRRWEESERLMPVPMDDAVFDLPANVRVPPGTLLLHLVLIRPPSLP